MFVRAGDPFTPLRRAGCESELLIAVLLVSLESRGAAGCWRRGSG
jgi:hypothetical protein